MKAALLQFIAAGLLAVAAIPAVAQETTPAMVAAAEKEGKVVWYTAVDVKVAEAIANEFRAQYPRIDIDVERSGSERVFQRIGQEVQSGIHNVDVVNSSDASHFLYWKQQKLLATHVPPDVQRFASQYKDPDGQFATWRATLNVMGYNTNLVDAKDAPSGYVDLLDPKWKGKLVKAHPGYSGTSLTGTYALVKVLGWDYFEKLAKQGVQQLQSTTAPPKTIASGERAVMVDGNEYNMFIEIDAKSPVKIIYAKEGTPFVASPTAIFASAPHPNAARVLQNFLYTAKVQQLAVTKGGTRSVHPDVKDPPGRTPLSQIKLLPDDPAGMLPQVAEIKRHYTALFGN
ncbi:MAG TPA: extracellular solute-binding protein [Casimicrobiaceae bacterium]|nr:extracellular solute-binding protein [Casimicrobiaceae bacterium]